MRLVTLVLTLLAACGHLESQGGTASYVTDEAALLDARVGLALELRAEELKRETQEQRARIERDVRRAVVEQPSPMPKIRLDLVRGGTFVMRVAIGGCEYGGCGTWRVVADGFELKWSDVDSLDVSRQDSAREVLRREGARLIMSRLWDCRQGVQPSARGEVEVAEPMTPIPLRVDKNP
jgi:hypothetical protein